MVPNDPISPESQGGAAGEGQTVLRLTSTTSGGWAVADYYLWGPATDFLLCDEKVTSPTTVDINWTLGDDLNSIRDIAQYNTQTQTTTIIDHRCYSAFGAITLETNASIDLSFSFTGRPTDTYTQLQNNLNRWYFASCGRWLNPDPDEFYAGDPNLYRYCENRTTSRTDPSGLQGLLAPVPEPPTMSVDALLAPGTPGIEGPSGANPGFVSGMKITGTLLFERAQRPTYVISGNRVIITCKQRDTILGNWVAGGPPRQTTRSVYIKNGPPSAPFYEDYTTMSQDYVRYSAARMHTITLEVTGTITDDKVRRAIEKLHGREGPRCGGHR